MGLITGTLSGGSLPPGRQIVKWGLTLPKHDSIKNPTKQQVKSLRRTYKILKQKGIIKSKTSPSKVKLTRSLREKLVKLQPAARGKAFILPIVRTPVATKAQAKKAFIQAGHLVEGDSLIIPKKPRTISFVDKRGFVTTRAKSGKGFITRVILPIPYIDLAQWIENAERMKGLDRLKSNDEAWGFSFFGGNSHKTFSTIADMLEQFRYYLSVDAAIEKGNASEMRELFRNLELVRIRRPVEDFWEANKGTKGGGNARFMRDLKRGGTKFQLSRRRKKEHRPKQFAIDLARDAARKRKWRASLKGKERKKYLTKERKRHVKT